MIFLEFIKAKAFAAKEFLSMPIGFKNRTDGNVEIAMNAILSAKNPHTFMGVDINGCACIVTTNGNSNLCVVLRGDCVHGSNIKVGKTEGHHKGVVRQIFDASNGLNQKYRLKSAKYMEKRIGFELGYHGRNVEPVPIRFHPRVHAIINSRISSSPDRFNVEGIAKRLGFPKNWQSVLTYEERLPLYNEVADAIRESVDAINTSWKVLLSRSDDLTTYSKEEYLDLMLQHKKLDDRLRQVTSPSFMADSFNVMFSLKAFFAIFAALSYPM